MGAASLIAVKDLKLRLRDRSSIIIGIIAPLVLAVVFNLIFGSAGDPTVALDLRYGVVDMDGGPVAGELVAALEGAEDEGMLTVEPYGSREVAEAAVEDGEIDAFYLIPEGLGQSIMSGSPATIQVIGGIDEPTSTNIAASIAEQFSGGVEAVQLALQTALATGSSPPSPSADPTEAALSFTLADESAETRQLGSTTYYAAAMTIFFIFFTVQYGVLGLLEEERDGTLTRLMAAPTQRSSIVLGKAILAFTLGATSATVLVAATSLDFLMGADWGAPAGVALLVVAGVLSAVGVMGLAAAFAKTAEGAGNLGAIIAVILGMLGGVFFPVGQGEDLLAKLTFLTPHAWFLRGLGDLAGGAPWADALPATGAMLIFAAVTGGGSWALLNRRLSR